MNTIINYHNKQFKVVSNTPNGETSNETIFNYQQHNNILTCVYTGGKIKSGHLIGIVSTEGHIDMRYHQVNIHNQLMTGICKSRPEVLSDGKIRLHETWQWTSDDLSSGTSIIEEI